MRSPGSDATGSASVETVLAALLVAAAAALAVAAFSRGVARPLLTAAEAATLRHAEARAASAQRRAAQRTDGERAGQYHDGMHR